MKKGFTLIELLAVIVILSVITLITIPMITNVIEESKKKALASSIQGLVESANLYSIENDGVYEFLFDKDHRGSTIKGESLDYRGTIDGEGKLYLDKEGNISVCISNDKYYVYKNYNSGIIVGERRKDNCNIEYDALTNKYVAFLESEGTGSNVYSKDEVNNLVDEKTTELNNKITNNTNEITNMKSNIEELQNNLNNYALQSELDKTNSNLNNLSDIVSNNQIRIYRGVSEEKTLSYATNTIISQTEVLPAGTYLVIGNTQIKTSESGTYQISIFITGSAPVTVRNISMVGGGGATISQVINLNKPAALSLNIYSNYNKTVQNHVAYTTLEAIKIG